MNGTSIRYVAIWPGGLRLAHWLLAAGVLFCLASGWALQQLPADPAFWHDWHIITGQITALALLLRSVLLFVPGSTHWRALLPKRGQWQACRQMLRFYLSLSRAPLPAWYAHNPLWAPVYLLVLAVEAACLATGFGYSSSWQLLKVPVAQLHSGSATARPARPGWSACARNCCRSASYPRNEPVACSRPTSSRACASAVSS